MRVCINIGRIFPLALWTFMLFNAPGVLSQMTTVNTFHDQAFYRGKDLFDKEKYAAAQEVLSGYIEEGEAAGYELVKEASYMHALCAMRLFNYDAEYLMISFISNYPESRNIESAYFEMGRYAYEKKRYANAIKWFTKLDKHGLSGEAQAEYYFKLGYSYFQQSMYEEARVTLSEITENDTKYTGPALYYYSHIAYEEENYETALQGFLRLQDDETFRVLVPYYITHLYYLQKKWDELVEYAPQYLESISEKRYAEMARIIGEAYYYTDNFTEAISYLNKYHGESSYTSPQDKYQLGFSYYMTGEYVQARDYFRDISLQNNELAQSALYHLGDCYLKLDEKMLARQAFAAAAGMDFNQQIKQDALFNQAVVAYELSYSPFNEVIGAFERYIELYPASDRTDEAYNYLVLAYMNTKNYMAALSSLEKIKRKDQNIDKAYQRVAFFRGLELFNNLRFEEALEKFDKSLEYDKYDLGLKALCYYWKGETYYRQEEYEKAIEFYNNFMASEGAFELNVYNTCHYNIAYCWFKMGDNRQALSWFRKFIDLDRSKSSRMLGDAYNRIGDLYYMDSKYSQAIGYYDQAIELGSLDVDYALYQKGISQGISANHRNKIATLKVILSSFPQSSYMADALFEIGRSHFILKEEANSMPYYRRIIDEFPNSSYVRKSLVELGLISYNQNRSDEALKLYKRVVADFPGTAEADNALLAIRNVYMDENQVNEYVEYLESLGKPVGISEAEKDSLTYTAAENNYLQGDCEKSKKNFANYIRNFENGKFLVNAHFYRAECHVKALELKEALASYNYIASQSLSPFTEPALLSASRINYKYLKDYPAALLNYLALAKIAEVESNRAEARLYIMRCYFLLEEFEKTIEAAREVLKDDKLSEEIEREARYKIASSYYEQARFVLAREEYARVAHEVKSMEGAESKYRVAEIHYIRKEYEKAEDEVFDFADQNSPHQYWMAKAFILLSDVYLALDDDFQASATLESIIDYYKKTDDGILDLALRKKAEILKRAEQSEERPRQEDIELNLDEEKKEGGLNEEL